MESKIRHTVFMILGSYYFIGKKNVLQRNTEGRSTTEAK